MVSLALDPPPSNRRQPPASRPLLGLIVVVVLGATFGAGFWIGRVTGRRAAEAAAAEAGGTAAAGTGATTPTGTTTTTTTTTPTTTGPGTTTGTGTTTVTAAGTGTTTAGGTTTPIPNAAAPAAPAAPAGPRRLVVTLVGPLEDGIAKALGGEERATAAELTQVVNRLLVWDLHVARDGRKGDRLEVLWRPAQAAAPGLPASGEPVVEAVRYASQKLGTVVAAYRFQPEGARFAHYYRPDGSELELRLAEAPLTDYEQITSLLKDGRRHKGVDFKTPVGSPVHATFDGVVERRNWNFAGNGNCLDIRDARTGRHAIFLHLDVLPKEMTPGRAVKKGDVVASSGNSGHSFAPHLHYQLEAPDGRVLDPFQVQKTQRQALDAAQKATFEAARARLDGAFAG